MTAPVRYTHADNPHYQRVDGSQNDPHEALLICAGLLGAVCLVALVIAQVWMAVVP